MAKILFTSQSNDPVLENLKDLLTELEPRFQGWTFEGVGRFLAKRGLRVSSQSRNGFKGLPRELVHLRTFPKTRTGVSVYAGRYPTGWRLIVIE